MKRRRFALFAKNKTSGKIFGAYLMTYTGRGQHHTRLVISDNATRVFELGTGLQDLGGLHDDVKNFLKDLLVDGRRAPENLMVHRYASGVAGLLNSKRFKKINPTAYYGE